MDFLKSVVAALVVMALPILVAVCGLMAKSKTTETEITITPTKTYNKREVVSNQNGYRVVRNIQYRWERRVVDVKIDTVKVNDAADVVYINHAVGISGW